ncbi:Efflux transporter periplasmic adaptor subunit [Gammaproteobacteria bacterium]
MQHNGRKIIIILIIVLLALLMVSVSRLRSMLTLRHEAKNNTTVLMSVITPKKSDSEEDLVLPGNVEAWHQAVIYARTNGYVKNWFTPIGTRVRQGDVLAEIETPEIDAQLRQAEADLKTAEANYDLAKITAKRWKNLRKTDSVSKQEADEKIADAKAKEAALASAKANRDHLYELSIFKTVRAPFDGIIYARSIDVGMLVNAGNNPGQPLFRIVQADVLRVYVKVPQNNSARIVSGVRAEVHFVEHPGEVYKANLYGMAKNLDQLTRTMLTEFHISNTDGKLFAGGYAEVHIKLPSALRLRLPVNALIFRAAGLQVATVVAGKVVLKNIAMGRDFGNEVEIKYGLSPNDVVIVNPPDSLKDGQQVSVN